MSERVRYDAQKAFDEAEKLAGLAGLAGVNPCFSVFLPVGNDEKHALGPAKPANPAKILDEPAAGECSGCGGATIATILAWLRRGHELYPLITWGPATFGLDPVAPLARYDGMGLVWLLKGRERVSELTAAHARLSGGNVFYRQLTPASEEPIATETATPAIPTPEMRTIHFGRRTRR
jgi:hypothetical protein